MIKEFVCPSDKQLTDKTYCESFGRGGGCKFLINGVCTHEGYDLMNLPEVIAAVKAERERQAKVLSKKINKVFINE